jgi:hypothetical protein
MGVLLARRVSLDTVVSWDVQDLANRQARPDRNSAGGDRNHRLDREVEQEGGRG